MIYIVVQNKHTKEYKVQKLNSDGCIIPHDLYEWGLNTVYVATTDEKYRTLIKKLEEERGIMSETYNARQTQKN